MKNLTKNAVLLLAALLLAAPIFSQADIEEAIKKTCNAETQAWLNNDVEAWAKQHLQSEQEVLAGIGDDGNYFEMLGWEKTIAAIREWAKNSKPRTTKLETSNHRFNILGDVALVNYDQTLIETDGKTVRSREFRVLSRTSEGWKIVSVLAFYQKPEEKK